MPRLKKSAKTTIDKDKKYYGISELSKEFNVTPRTIRHYEDEGLIEPARRGQTRLFTEEDRARLELALVGKRLGIHLGKLRELFDQYDNARGDEKRTRQLIELLSQQRKALTQQQADIQRMVGELEHMEKQCRGTIEKKQTIKRDLAQPDLFG